MKTILVIEFILAAMLLFAGKEYPELPQKITDETPAQKTERMAWWRHDHFGMFIHFGLYAALARHEWVQGHKCVDTKDYAAKYMPRFTLTFSTRRNG